MSTQATGLLVLYGTTHLLVDGTCAAMTFSVIGTEVLDPVTAWCAVLGYDLLAFASQAFLGLGVDRWRAPRGAAVLGCLMVVSGVALARAIPVPAIFLAGLGNALFHVGGGAISLNLSPGGATAPGIFVAPGGLGLTLGMMYGKGGHFVAWPFALLLLAACIPLFIHRMPRMDYRKPLASNETGSIEIAVGLLCFAVAVRSLVGSLAVMPFRADISMVMALTIAAELGKGLGGILADRLGWLRTTVWATLMSAPLTSFGGRTTVLIVIGVFLVQFAMPVTLAAIARLFPGRPSFAFGLACLALIIGTMPSLFGFGALLDNRWLTCSILLMSTAAVYQGLRLAERRFDRDGCSSV